MSPVHRVIMVFSLICCSIPIAGRAEEGDALRKVSSEFLEALLAGREDKIRQRIATFEEISSVSNRVKDKKEYQQAVDDWVNRRIREFKEARKKGPVAFNGVEIKDTMIFYPDNDKIKKTGVLAIVQPLFTIKGKPQKGFFPLFFIQIGHQWKVSIKK